MQYERLVIEAGDDTFTLDLHRRMTVIAGVGRLEREGLITELIGALGRGRSGVHAEIASDAGDRYAIFRPAGSRHRVVDIDRAADVTDHFASGEQIDLLERAGITATAARRKLRLSPADLVTGSMHDGYMAALAGIDQHRLWDVVDRVSDRDQRLLEAARVAGAGVEDAMVFEEIERRHTLFEEAAEAHERVRYLSFVLGAGSALVGVSAVPVAGFWAALPFLVLAIAATAISIIFWQRVERARADEDRALSAAGATSYLSFQINRVNGLLTSDHARRQMMRAAEDHRAALVEWRVLAGDVPVAWAAEHRSEIRRHADTMRLPAAGGSTSSEPHDPIDLATIDLVEAEPVAAPDGPTIELAHAVVDRLNLVKTIGAGGESFPLFIDDALADVDPGSKPELLELLMRASAAQQVIYLTEDPAVASWARIEALTGNLAIVEPAANEAIEPLQRSPRRLVG